MLPEDESIFIIPILETIIYHRESGVEKVVRVVTVPPLLRGVRGDPQLFDLVRPWVVRYGARFPNTCYEVEHHGKPAPNTPYGITP